MSRKPSVLFYVILGTANSAYTGLRLGRTQWPVLVRPTHCSPSATKRVPFTTGTSLGSSGARGYAQLFLKPMKLRGIAPDGAGMNERSCHEHYAS
jgi:hypothetical protein